MALLSAAGRQAIHTKNSHKNKRQRYAMTKFYILLCSLTTLTLADGLAGEYLVSSRWREWMVKYSPLTNPSLISNEEYITLRGVQAMVLQNTFFLSELGVVVPIGLKHTAGVSYFGEGARKLEDSYQWDAATGTLQPSAKGSNRNNLFLLTYSYRLLRKLQLGVNIGCAINSNFGDPYANISIDLGGQYHLFSHRFFGSHHLGLTLLNVLAPAGFASSSYVNTTQLSWTGKFFEERVEAGIEMTLKDVLAEGTFFNEFDTMEKDIAIRIGGVIAGRLFPNFHAGSGYWGVSLGVELPPYTRNKDMQVGMQLVDITRSSSSMAHSYFFRVEMGQSRLESWGKNYLYLSATELYNKARRLYHKEKYWESYFLFGQILAQYPQFFKNDWVVYYRGRCLEELDMREGALKNYTEAKENSTRDRVVPYALLGEMRIYYRNERYAAVSQANTTLKKSEASDSLLSHGAYLQGLVEMKQGNYRDAVDNFISVPPEHPDYLFALHSCAIAHIAGDNDTRRAIMRLKQGVRSHPDTPLEEQIWNRSKLFLAYLFYEDRNYSDALELLGEFPRSSLYYEDALLLIGWGSLRSAEWKNAIIAGQLLQKFSTYIPLQSEGALIEAYVHFRGRNYAKAASVCSETLERLSRFDPVSPDSIHRERQRNLVVRLKYNNLATVADGMSKQIPTVISQQRADSLHSVQKGLYTEIDRHYDFVYDVDRLNFFSRSLDRVRRDLEYLLAVSSNLIKQQEAEEIAQEAAEKQKEIEKEIEKTEKELKELEGEQGSE
jgi:tetratricopeptide (TPR) repeat protein